MKPLSLLAVVCIPSLLAGCVPTGGYQSPEYRPPEGSILELTRVLPLRQGSTRVFLQGGEPRSWSDINEFTPYCSFGVNRQRGEGPPMTEIRADTFTVRDTRIWVEAAREPAPRPLRVASREELVPPVRLARAGASAPDAAGLPWPFTYLTRFELYSGNQPRVDDLTCSYEGESMDRNLKLDAIRDTLGELVLLR